jgi:CRISPR-associated protein Cas1
MRVKNLRELPKLRDSLSYLYVQHSRVEQKHKGIAFYTEDGEVAVPAASLSALLLGPGSSITHAAIRQLAENGCGVSWVGEEGVRFYAFGLGETRSSAALMRQAEAWADPRRRLQVVRSMYEMRFAEPLDSGLSIQQVRGLEGVRVREAYARASRATGVPWHGRNYKRESWADADPVNRALSAGSACLYGVVHAAIVSLGYSAGLGFIHTGKQLSFVYDIADIYKAESVIPTAFDVVGSSDYPIESKVRARLRDSFREQRLLARIARDLDSLFDLASEAEDPYAVDAAAPGDLWDPSGLVSGGVAYGSDDPGNGSSES